MNFIRTGEKSIRRKRKMDPEAVIPEVLPEMPEDPVRAVSTEMPEDPVPTVSRDIPVAQVP